MTTKEIGNFGEEMACRYLESKGIQIIKRNFYAKSGEIDIIAKAGDTLLFCEVKTRFSADYGRASEFVDFRKQDKIRKTALYYTMRDDIDMRFDVLEIYYHIAGDCLTVDKVNHIEDAF